MARVLFIAFAIIALAGFGGFLAWAVYESNRIAGGWENLAPVWPYVAGGLLVVGLLTGGLMWLAFYSDRHGFDDQQDGR